MDSILNQLSLGTLSESFLNERIDSGVALSMSDSALTDLGVNTSLTQLVTVFDSGNCAQSMRLIKGKQMRMMKTRLPLNIGRLKLTLSFLR